MRRSMFPKLAVTNLVKNRRIYVPYLLTCIFTMAMFYIMQFLTYHEALGNMSGGADIQMILQLGVAVITIFSGIFLLYSDSFLMKRRKKELGLYNVLGMEKKHIGAILFYEQIYTVILSVVLGIGLGILGSKLMLLLLLKLVQFEVPFGFLISGKGIVNTLTVFGVIFLLTFIVNVRQIHLVNPIELLQGSNAGEREPKAKWIMVVLGVLSMGTGYYIAVSVQNPLDALLLFFVAVILVMLGTYLLFTAGSIAVLKFLRWKKKFYYKTSNFISVSGMIYRMKQNAVGLASICILSTGVLLMISSTVSLYLGQKDVTETRYPREVQVNLYRTDGQQEQEFVDGIQEIADTNSIKLQEIFYYRSMSVTCIRENGELSFRRPDSFTGLPKGQELVMISLLPEEEYNRLTGSDYHLTDGELLVYQSQGSTQDSLLIHDKKYQVTALPDFPEKEWAYGVEDAYYIALNQAEFDRLAQLQREVYTDNPSLVIMSCGVEPALSAKEEKLAFTDLIRSYVKEFCEKHESSHISGYADGRTASEQSFLSTYGGMFFLGLFLGSLFLMGTALIIYYKQVSEGYEDQRRYEIMQKVGLSKQEVRGSIRSQILMVFFLPLLMAMVHIGFAFPMIRRLLSIFYLENVKLFALCTLGTIGVFALAYGVIYLLTARVYYKIIKAY